MTGERVELARLQLPLTALTLSNLLATFDFLGTDAMVEASSRGRLLITVASPTLKLVDAPEVVDLRGDGSV